MTRQDFFIKWGVYTLALLPVWFCELYVLNRFPLFGVAPMLLPLAAMAVAVLEGTMAGAGFGLGVGILCDAVYFNPDGAMTLGLCLLGFGAGALAQYVLRQNLLGCLLCSLLALVCIDAVRILARLLAGSEALPAMLSLAGREIAWSMVFVFPIYALFLWVFRRVPKKTVL
ncbi:rod shape-determining protein MreD [uncultured Flavonifractor sp.]|uniref:rod shape-determining protein MreD n=1 Tax=uncultured Flavonifractor sp. TaxID=1193534 RepID=UPI00260F27AF|nr:rod shape-determining protein MreD [uncultured Flavonifractor sp.]